MSDRFDTASSMLLRRHVISVDQGRAKESDLFGREQLAAIFEVHLPIAIKAAQQESRSLPVVLYAHGGLVAESAALAAALTHLSWWQANGAFPIYWIWHTGFLHMVARTIEDAAAELGLFNRRDMWDHTTDPLIEAAGHAMGADAIWSAMKRSAERAAAPTGLGTTVVEYLSRLKQEHGDSIEFHLIGHSAGAIFQAEFLHPFGTVGLTASSLAFLAPAIRIDQFQRQVMPKLRDKSIEAFSLFGMQEWAERNDQCAGIYRKSLLYFVSKGCEEGKSVPILGLEEHLLSNREVAGALISSGSERLSSVECVWSPTPISAGRSASTSTTHGGFDDDAPTMESVARRVLSRDDASPISASFPRRALRSVSSDSWRSFFDWPEELEFIRRYASSSAAMKPPLLDDTVSQSSVTKTTVVPNPRMEPYRLTSSTKKALCVGINAYSTQELRGCVSDSQQWAAWLRSQGFSVATLFDGEATKDSITAAINTLLKEAHAGDVIVFQYAGHGTSVPVPASTICIQAIVPSDGEAGELIWDYELKRSFDTLTPDVNLTTFMDCCHAETNTRGFFAWARAFGAADATFTDVRSRFLQPTPAMIAAATLAAVNVPAPSGMMDNLARDWAGFAMNAVPRFSMKNVSFAACRDTQSAYEENGNGRFTQRALSVVTGLSKPITNREVQQLIVQLFAPMRDIQEPRLDSIDTLKDKYFLEPTVAVHDDYTGARFDEAMKALTQMSKSNRVPFASQGV